MRSITLFFIMGFLTHSTAYTANLKNSVNDHPVSLTQNKIISPLDDASINPHTLYDIWYQTCNDVLGLLQLIQGAINKGSLLSIDALLKQNSSVSEKKAAAKRLMDARGFSLHMITELHNKQHHFFDGSLEQLQQRIHILAAVMQELQQAIHTKFANVEQINLEQIVLERPVGTTEIELFQTLTIDIPQQARALRVLIENVGQTPLSRAIQRIDRVARQLPWNAISTVATLGAVGIGLHYGIQYSIGYLSDDLQVAKKLQESGLRLLPGVFATSFAQLIVPSPHNLIARLTEQAFSSVIINTAHSWWGQVKKQSGQLQKKVRSWYEDYLLRKTPTIDLDLSKATLTLDSPSLIGMEEVRRHFIQLLDFIVNAEVRMRSGFDMPRCMLLAGPSSTGKSSIIQALVNSINLLFNQQGSEGAIELVKIDLGAVTKTESTPWGYTLGLIDQAILVAKNANHPVIIFIDEIHLLGLNKNGDPKLLSEFLTKLREGIETINNPQQLVFIIAATNQPHELAPELFMKGRFSTVLHMQLPGFNERVTYFKQHILENAGIVLKQSSIEKMASLTQGANYGHLDDIVRSAKNVAIAENRGVTDNDLYQQIYKHIFGITQTLAKSITDSNFSHQEKLVVATHQAGKIMTHRLLGATTELVFSTIGKVHPPLMAPANGQSTQLHSYLQQSTYGTTIFLPTCELRNQIIVDNGIVQAQILLGGLCAQTICCPNNAGNYGNNDRNQAFELIRQSILKGLDWNKLSPSVQDAITRQAVGHLNELETKLMTLLEAEKSALEKLTQLLISKPLITPTDIESALQASATPDDNDFIDLGSDPLAQLLLQELPA